MRVPKNPFSQLAVVVGPAGEGARLLIEGQISVCAGSIPVTTATAWLTALGSGAGMTAVMSAHFFIEILQNSSDDKLAIYGLKKSELCRSF